MILTEADRDKAVAIILFAALECSSLYHLKTEFCGGSLDEDEFLMLIKNLLRDDCVELVMGDHTTGPNPIWVTIQKEQAAEVLARQYPWEPSEPFYYEVAITDSGRKELDRVQKRLRSKAD